MIMVLYGAIWGKTRFDVKQVTFASPDLPAAFDGIVSPRFPTYTRVVGTETGQPYKKPWTGQRPANRFNCFHGMTLSTQKPQELEPFENILAQLKAPDGVFSILGNHDYGPYHNWPTTEARDQNIRDIQDKQAVMGWQLLNNDHVILKRAADSIALIGVENNGEPPFSTIQ